MKGFHSTLYKRVDGALRYRSAWSERGVLYQCEGMAGESAELRETLLPSGADARQHVSDALDQSRKEGYAQLDINAFARLLVEHDLGRACTAEDADDRIILEYRIGDVLDRTGLGGTSGGEVWPTSYEVFCFVADFEVARRVIAADLLDTKYAKARIFEEDPALWGPIRNQVVTVKG